VRRISNNRSPWRNSESGASSVSLLIWVQIIPRFSFNDCHSSYVPQTSWALFKYRVSAKACNWLRSAGFLRHNDERNPPAPLCMHSTCRELNTNENAGATFSINLHYSVGIALVFRMIPYFSFLWKTTLFVPLKRHSFVSKRIQYRNSMHKHRIVI